VKVRRLLLAGDRCYFAFVTDAAHPLSFHRAVPDDTDLDAFSSGVAEVDTYFRSRQWFNTQKSKASPPTYQFRNADDEVVGYAAVSYRKCDHPEDGAPDRAKYLSIYVTGLHERFHGTKNPAAPNETYAESMFRVLEDFACGTAGCVGMYLWVRANNARAIAFYEKVGFVGDAAGPVQRDTGARHLTMRKVFGPAT